MPLKLWPDAKPARRGRKLQYRELALHYSVKEAVDLLLLPHCRYEVGWQGLKLTEEQIQRLLKLGVTPGWPDWKFYGRYPNLVQIELKRDGKWGGRKGTLSEDQKAHQAWCEANGWHYYVCHSVDEVLAVLRAHGFLRGAR